jgi:hypothetical protein
MTITFDPGRQTFISTETVKKAKSCPVCGSDRETTRKIIPLSTPDGTAAGSGPCPDAWHSIERSDGRIGGASVTPSATRALGVPRG